jgi:hypothetical protein
MAKTLSFPVSIFTMVANHTLSKGDEYRHPDGAVEIVLAIEDGRVVTVSEYRSCDHFREAVSEASYRGVDDAVAALPPVSVFAERVPDERPDGHPEDA